MEQLAIKNEKPPIILKILLFLFLFTVFFPIRHVFFNNFAYLTGQYSDFTSFSLYLSDIFLTILALSVIFPRGKSFWEGIKSKGWLVLWLLVIFLLTLKANWPINAYFLAKWLEFIVAYGTFFAIFKNYDIKSFFFKLFLAFSSLQSILAIIQFKTQAPVGLNRLGEELISPKVAGFAKIVVDSITYVRGYGTFPHSNLLSAFLLIGIFICLYLWLQTSSKIARVIYTLLLAINILGLTVAFSRAAYLALAIGLVIFFGYLIFMAGFYKKPTVWWAVGLTLVVLMVSYISFRPFLLTRETITDNAVSERVTYAQIGIKMLKANPIFGVGIGESVLHMKQYSSADLQPWQIQPPHNYFLIATDELGIPGALILFAIFLAALWKIVKKLWAESFDFQLVTFNLSLVTILICILVLMQFDHYFYTLQQTQLLLWMLLGIIGAQISKPASLNWQPGLQKSIGQTKNPQAGD